MKFFPYALTGLFFLSWINLPAQIAPNDDCNGATFIPVVTDYCSTVGEFSTVNATRSSQSQPGCFVPGQNGDVWFAFTAVNTGISIRIIGATPFFSGGTLRQPQAALYSGTCGNLSLLDCNADDTNNQNLAFTNVSTLQNTQLNVGETYFIRIEGQNSLSGTFQLCLSSFNPVPPPNSDCSPGVLLCDKSPFLVPFLTGNGNDSDEVDGPPCSSGTNGSCSYEELQSAWYKWICKDPGTLTFNLTPLNPTDDLDFWVYELPGGVDDCSNKLPLLCMASGANVGSPVSTWLRCHGPTGLRTTETDDHEDCGCATGDNNYIRPLQMEAGKAYALVVMNFSSTGDGFTISFGGTGTFVGPEVDFAIDPELNNKCDVDTLFFTDLSKSGIGNITRYEWNFGTGAAPRTSNSEGPHEVVYNSFGTKNIVLRITTSAGCTVTDIRQVFIEPCCDPAFPLMLDILDVRDPLCPGTESGLFAVGGRGGTPAYLYSLDGVNFTPLTQYNGRPAGAYNIWIQDIKGCRDSNTVLINDPPPFTVDAGPDQTINLGDETDLRATVVTSFPAYTIEWRTDSTLGCFDCLDPHVITATTTTYHITVSNPLGCRSVDSVTVFVEIIRPVYIPSGFSPNDDGLNDFFTVYAGKQARLIKKLLVFDRWGNLVYEGKDLAPSIETLGWDGKFKGKKMDPGVFAYFTEIEFIDGVVIPFEGDVSLLR